MANELRKRFGRLVTANRRRVGFTQQELADKSGVSVDMINRIERGVMAARFPNIEKLADAMRIDPAELFTPDLPAGAGKRQALSNVTARLAKLSDPDLAWLDQVLDAVLKHRR